MQIRQLFAVMGLCLSQSRAASVNSPSDDAIKSFVMLLTDREAPLESSPMVSKVSDAFRGKANQADVHQMSHELIGAFQPLLDANHQRMHDAADGYAAFHETARSVELQAHPEVQARRLKKYQDYIYSAMKDIANDSKSLLTSEKLSEVHSKIHMVLGKKTGAGENPLKTLAEEAANLMTSKIPVTFEYLTKEDINKALMATNKDGVPPAQLLDGEALKRFIAPMMQKMQDHHNAHHQAHFHGAQFHQAHPPVLAA
ncbi:hypothetical protein MJO29_007563 [Puccinia striiformis f. sp. tritici]|nr:hypothetical protein Pst134EB_033488 [Puccinia striiformis f. sp. tritici]KAI7956164.1 hypothetical protein MJO29_007563 [Puccinia striiformis f. sp. tritici]KAI9612840.1 hypothetical protein KEM48_004076 [Puccinia striiformis f. sp. tritici PST-130]